MSAPTSTPVSVPVSTEVCTYTLSYQGRPVGSQLLSTSAEEQGIRLGATLLLQGELGQHSVSQSSLLALPELYSLNFTEKSESRAEKRSFEVVFDARSGLVRATRRAANAQERADTPYLRPYSDPLGLLYRLRKLAESYRAPPNPTETHPPEGQQQRVPMLGKDVIVRRLADTELDTPLGVRTAHAFVLYPGSSYVYIEAKAPHLIVRLTQRLDEGMLDALLVRVAYEAEAVSEPPAAAPPSKRRRRGGRRRRKESGS